MIETKSKLDKRPLLLVMFTIFVDMLGYGILIPIVPQLLGNQESIFSVLPVGMSINTGYILLGFLVGIYPLMQFISTPILGQLSDRFGRKKILAFSLTGTCLSYVAFAIGVLTRNIPLLFISRGFDGITGGNISVAQAAIADVSTPENRSRNFGFIGAALGLGLIIGPYIGGKLSDPNLVSWFNPATPFWFAAGLSLINATSVIFFFPETLTGIKKHFSIMWFKSVHNVGAAFRMKALRVPFISTFLFQAGFSFFITFFSVYLINKYSFSQGSIGDIFAYFGIWAAISQVFVNSNVSKWFSEHNILKVSLVAFAACISLFFVPKTESGLLFILPFFAMFYGLIQANFPALISKSVGPDKQGEILGVNSSINTLGQSITPIASGYIAALITPNAPIIVASITIFFAGLIFWLFYRPMSQRTN
ncbi:MAG TPA: MFS transporter [Patescibacteria group bacterium]|jgi:DHA1 family tetracycline resistance protein-like MFS transporter|nr:MFS transporter [Patescibacteria group bacterium]